LRSHRAGGPLSFGALDTLDSLVTAVKVSRMRRSGHRGNHDQVPRTPERPSERVEADLRRRVEAGEWASGDALPTVASLAEHYGVARGSVARALRALEDEGLVRIVARWGTFRA
jgi:DNA-binding transcriptional ArsR family regulator